MALYMGPSSNFGYKGDAGGGNPPRAIWGQPMNGAGQSKTVSTGAPASPAAAPPNTLAAQAIRASGPSQGYDPNYLQNMASSIGSLFSSPGGGTVNVNPLGDLSDISPPSQMEGNAPSPGLPLTWLQRALNGGGFSFAQPTTVTPTAPTVGSVGSRGGGGGVRGGNNGGFRPL